MAKGTVANRLPRKVEQNLKIVGEQIRLARLRRDLSIAQIADRYALGIDEDILNIARDDAMGRTLQDLQLKHRVRASKK